MPTKSKPTSRSKTGSKNKKSKISTKLVAAIIIGIVAIAGIAIVFSSFASGPVPYEYSYNASCPKKTTNVNIKTGQVVSTTGTDIVTVPYDTTTDCLKNSAEAMAFRLYQTVYGKTIDYNTYKTFVQKLAGDRTQPQLLIPDSAVTEPADLKLYVQKMYKNALGRSPSRNEVKSWINKINNEKINRQDVAFLFASSAEAGVKNSGPFAKFIKANPDAVAIVPVAQNAQNARGEEAAKIVEGMRIANYAILVLRNEINSAGNYAVAKPKQDEVSRIMIDFSKGMEKLNELYTKSLSANKDQAVDITKMNELKKQADDYLASSWVGTVEAGQRAEKYRVDEENARIAAQNRKGTTSSPSPSISGQCRAPLPLSEFRKAPLLTSVFGTSISGRTTVATYETYQIRTRPGICVNGRATHGDPGPWRDTSRKLLRVEILPKK